MIIVFGVLSATSEVNKRSLRKTGVFQRCPHHAVSRLFTPRGTICPQEQVEMGVRRDGKRDLRIDTIFNVVKRRLRYDITVATARFHSRNVAFFELLIIIIIILILVIVTSKVGGR